MVLFIGALVTLFSMEFGDSLVRKNRTFFYANTIRDAIAFARMSAVVHGQRVIFCHGSDTSICKNVKPGVPMVITESGKILRVLPRIFSGDRLLFKISGTGSGRNLVFLPRGVLDGHNGSFFYCPRGRSDHAVAIIFNKVGRIRLATVDAQGNKINCNF